MTAELTAAVTALRSALADKRDFVDPFNAVITTGARAPVADKDAAIASLLDGAGADPVAVAYLAVASGALVEQSGSPVAALGVLLDALADAATTLAAAGDALDDADLDAGTAPDTLEPHARTWARVFARLVVGTMARLARSVEARAAARAHPRLDAAIRALQDRADAWHVRFIIEMLDILDGELLLVEPPRVTWMRAIGIRSCFHLLAVLEDANGTTRGYYTWRYLTVSSNRAIDQIQTMLPGDLRALDIPAFDGIRVVVRTPKDVHRMWDDAFVSPVHDALDSSVVVERELPEAEARALIERMTAG
jgi:hypothetical protein